MQYPKTSKTLIDKLCSGDTVSWDEFYDRYKSVIVSVGKYRGLTSDECNDLVQEVMIRFFKNAKSFVFDPQIAKFRTYFGRIVSGKIIDILRKRIQTVGELSPEDERQLGLEDSPDKAIDEFFMDQWRQLVLAEAREKLKTRVTAQTYEAFELYGEQHRDIKKVSAALGMTCNQIYVAKARCVKILNEILAEMNESDPELGVRL